MTTNKDKGRGVARLGRLGRWVSDSWLILAAIGDTASDSFTHLRTLAERNGQIGWGAISGALIFDLVAIGAAREMQRDKRTNRERGFFTLPRVVFMTALGLTVLGNLAGAHHSLWGWIFAGAPSVSLMTLVGLYERRTGTARTAAKNQTRNQPAGTTATAGTGTVVPAKRVPARPGTAAKTGTDWVKPEGHRIDRKLHDVADDPRLAREAYDALAAANPGRDINADVFRQVLGVGKARACELLRIVRAQLAEREEISA